MIYPDLPFAIASVPPASAGGRPAATMVARLRQSELFREFQEAFEGTTGLPLVLREAGSFRTPLQGSRRANSFCTLMILGNQTCAACLRLQQRLEQAAMLGPKTMECYAGLSESAVPVRLGDTVLGYLQTGQVFLRAPSRKLLKEATRAVPAAQAGPSELAAAYFRTPVLARKQYDSIIRLLAIFARHLSAVSNQLLLSAATTEPAAVVKVRTFIAEHSSEKLLLSDVARTVNMSACYFCRIFREATGLTFTRYVARERVEVVKQKLLNPQIRISEAAYAAGFQSLSQFNRVFRRVVGEAPVRYRARLQGVNRKSLRPTVLVHAA